MDKSTCLLCSLGFWASIIFILGFIAYTLNGLTYG